MFPVSTVVASICQELRVERRNYKTSVFTGNIMVLPLVFSSLLVDVSLDHTTNKQTSGFSVWSHLREGGLPHLSTVSPCTCGVSVHIHLLDIMKPASHLLK